VDDKLEVIREQMEETRASLADKLEALETQLSDKVEGTAEAVANTVETVQETVSSVKDSLDLSKQVERHPWLMMGGAVVVGYVAGSLMTPSKPSVAEGYAEALPPPPTPIPAQRPAASSVHTGNGNGRHHAAEPAQEKEGPLQEGLQLLKGLALGSLMSVLREMLTKALPTSLAADATKVVDEMTEKLGGKPLASNPEDEGEGNEKRNRPEMGRSMGSAEGEGEKPVGQRHRRRSAAG